MHYFAPKNPQNISLKAGNNTTAEVVGIDFLYNQKWFDNNNAHFIKRLLEKM